MISFTSRRSGFYSPSVIWNGEGEKIDTVFTCQVNSHKPRWVSLPQAEQTGEGIAAPWIFFFFFNLDALSYHQLQIWEVCGLTPAITKIWNSICYRINLVKAEVIQKLESRHLFLKDLRLQSTELGWLKFDLAVYKLHLFCVFGTSAHSASERWRYSFCLGEFETIIISFYSSWGKSHRQGGQEQNIQRQVVSVVWFQQWIFQRSYGRSYYCDTSCSMQSLESPYMHRKYWLGNSAKFPQPLWPFTEQFNQMYQNGQL